MNQVIVSEEVVVDKEMRNLPGKYNKFAGFAYWLLMQMKDEQLLSGDSYEGTCKMMNLLSSDIAAQVEFYERYFKESAVTARMMKDDIKKAAKAKKVTKEPKAKKEPKVKKQQVEITNNDVIAKLVECANSVMVNEPKVELPSVHVMEEKKKRGRKPAEKPIDEKPIDEKPNEKVLEAEVSVTGVVEKKRGRKAVDKSTEVSVTETETVVMEKKKRGRKVVDKSTEVSVVDKKLATPELPVEEEHEEEIVLNTVSVDGVDYFYDDHNRLYNSEHSVIGTFDPNSLTISIL